jgi:hypothetical protein
MSQLSIIPTNESQTKHLKIEGTSRARKSNENFSKKSRKSHELQEEGQHNHESFKTLGGQIHYKLLKNLKLWSKEMRSSLEGSFFPETLISMSPSGSAKDQATPST